MVYWEEAEPAVRQMHLEVFKSTFYEVYTLESCATASFEPCGSVFYATGTTGLAEHQSVHTCWEAAPHSAVQARTAAGQDGLTSLASCVGHGGGDALRELPRELRELLRERDRLRLRDRDRAAR